MCRACGNRLPNAARFRCVICFPETVLLPDGGLGGEEPPPGGGDPDQPDDGGEGAAREVVFAGTREFERLLPDLAEATARDRTFFREGALEVVFERTRGYASDEARRADIDAAVGYEGFDDEEEAKRRREALRGAQLLARDLEAAEARGTLRPDLLCDAFGVAFWAIGVRAGGIVSEKRLALIGDTRLRFAIGLATPVTMPASSAGP